MTVSTSTLADNNVISRTKPVDFENVESRFNKAVSSSQYDILLNKIAKAKKIYVVANGGLHYVGSHMATDMTRLIPNKLIKSFDSFGFITSSANDHGWENIFLRWLETSAMLDDPNTTLVYGMSCSGNSKNVINSFNYAHNKMGFDTFLLSGRPSKLKEHFTEELSFDCEYYHSVECLSLMIFYDIVHQLGHCTPLINR